MGARVDQFHAVVTKEFLEANWQQFINFLSANFVADDIEAEDLAEEIIDALSDV